MVKPHTGQRRQFAPQANSVVLKYKNPHPTFRFVENICKHYQDTC